MSGIRIAQIGCGHWGKNLARNFAQLGSLAAIVDGNPDVAGRVSNEHDVEATTFDAVLADPNIDAVALATPAVDHAQMTLRSIEAGKHVFVEKPLALDPTEAEAIIAAAESAGRIVMVGHLLQYHPHFERLRQIVTSGGIGRIDYLFSNRMSLGKFRVEENVLWSFAPHDISMLLSLTGEEPQAVSAQGAAFVTPGIADWLTCQMTFPSGARGHIQVSWSNPYKEQRLCVIGSDGMIVFDDTEPSWERKLGLYRHSIDRSGPVPVPRKAEPEYIEVPHGEPLRAECQHFIDCIRDGRTPRTDAKEGLRVLRVLDRAERELAQSVKGTRP